MIRTLSRPHSTSETKSAPEKHAHEHYCSEVCAVSPSVLIPWLVVCLDDIMNTRNPALLGILAPVLAYSFIAVAIFLSPWFRWQSNALSDLGHAVRSNVAPIFNFGLLLTGILISLYALLSLRTYAKWTAISLAFTGFSLQTIGAFDEVYGFLHYIVSIIFFVSIGVTSIVYAAEKRSYLGLIGFIVVLLSWGLYFIRVYSAGVAVPELISTLGVLPWVAVTAFRTYRLGKS